MTGNSMPRALVTGGSQGLGRAFCNQLARKGRQVVSIDRYPPDTENENITTVRCDLSDGRQVNDILDKLEELAPFDLVILNAGASATGKFEAIPFAAYQKLVTLNAKTPMLLASQLAARGLYADCANLIFIASLSHYTGYPGAAVYAATKDAVAVYAKSIRKPFDKQGITVSCAFPGPLRTAQAERHAPRGANPASRMTADTAAEKIVAAARAGRPRIIPGAANRLFALAGRLAPGPVTWVMRRIIYEKLDSEVF